MSATEEIPSCPTGQKPGWRDPRPPAQRRYAHFTADELALIAELWPTPVQTKVIVAELGRKRSTIERKAGQVGLGNRETARARRHEGAGAAVT